MYWRRCFCTHYNTCTDVACCSASSRVAECNKFEYAEADEVPMFPNNLTISSCTVYCLLSVSNLPCKYFYQKPVISCLYWSASCVHPLVPVKHSLWHLCVKVCHLICVCWPTYLTQWLRMITFQTLNASLTIRRNWQWISLRNLSTIMNLSQS